MSAPATTCFVCAEAAFAAFDNKILTSTHCGHKVCLRCLQKHGGVTAGRRVGNGCGSGNTLNLKCPACLDPVDPSEWVDREAADSQMEQEKLVRQRVMAVFNLARSNFDTTPQYNDFLEKREEAVYTLAFGGSDAERKRLQEELEAYEADNQKLILECRQKAAKLAEDEIRDIVRKEGTFYELVQQNYRQGFRYFFGPNSCSLTHALQRAYPELFVTESDLVSNVGNISMFEGGIGGGGHPRPLQAGLVYAKIPRRPPTDKQALYRASGMSKELIGRRVMLELWGGLHAGLKE